MFRIPTWTRTRAQTFGGSDASATPSGQEIRSEMGDTRHEIKVNSRVSNPPSRVYIQGPAVGVAPTLTALRVRRLSHSSHTGIVCLAGIEPGTPRVTVSYASHYTTDTAEGVGVEPTRPCGSLAFQARPVTSSGSPSDSPGWNRTTDLLRVGEASSPLDHGTVSTPARSRTRNASFEARHDVRFTTRAFSTTAQGAAKETNTGRPHLNYPGGAALSTWPMLPIFDNLVNLSGSGNGL